MALSLTAWLPVWTPPRAFRRAELLLMFAASFIRQSRARSSSLAGHTGLRSGSVPRQRARRPPRQLHNGGAAARPLPAQETQGELPAPGVSLLCCVCGCRSGSGTHRACCCCCRGRCSWDIRPGESLMKTIYETLRNSSLWMNTVGTWGWLLARNCRLALTLCAWLVCSCLLSRTMSTAASGIRYAPSLRECS